ncbi:uncharacterized protein LOC141614653 [Silene latifolia]|uniref:uncharacterized protein LOC141614653 n=1 Tax=Silene latifolia TaxID=37657 RepID=UPI003D775115
MGKQEAEKDAHVVTMRDRDAEQLTASDIHVVGEFSDVFLDEIPGLPPKKDIDFNVELKPGTCPKSKALYRMAPKELEELKKQLHDLLDKGKSVHSLCTAISLPKLGDEMSKMGIHMVRKGDTVGDTVGDLTIEPDLYEDIKRKQELVLKIQERKSRVESGTVSRFSFHTDGSIRFDGRWCVPDDADLRRLSHQYRNGIIQAFVWQKVPKSSLFSDRAEAVVLGPQMVQDIIEQVRLIRQKMKAVKDRQKCVVAYKLDLPPALDRVHNVFLVSQLRKFVSDPSHVLEVENIEIDESLSYAEVPIEILDHKVRKTRNVVLK